MINWVHFVGKTLHSWIFIDTSYEVFDSIQYKKVLKLLSPIVLHSLVTYICKTINYCEVFNLNLGFFSWLKISKFSILNVFVTAMFPAEYWKITINNHNTVIIIFFRFSIPSKPSQTSQTSGWNVKSSQRYVQEARGPVYVTVSTNEMSWI